MAAASSSPFFGIRDEQQQQQQQQQSSSMAPSSSTGGLQTTGPAKKKRNLPGTPNPDAEVIALSPKTLMATNRFICEVCNKGFQREQNLQLHRRGHNLPWKLKQKSTKEVRRKVYLCPEPTCVHHDPSRALGDLTGIKKHFCRKHGEKKWKCDKCSKRYAVQSDWKAHSKTCGTREYRCDCGTLFSRRDSFITHRAFCDALAQESARLPTGLTALGGHLYGNNNMGMGMSQVNSQLSSLQDQNHPSADLLRLRGTNAGGGTQFDHHLMSSSNPSPFRASPHHQSSTTSPFYLAAGGPNQDHFNGENTHDQYQNKPFHGLMQLPDLQTNTNPSSTSAATAANLFNLSFFSNGTSNNTSSINNGGNNNALIQDQFNNGGGGTEPSALFSGTLMTDHQLYNTSMQNHESVLPQMSATALLQKAAQMGATTSGGSGSSMLRGFGSSSSGSAKGATTNFRGGDQSLRSQMESETHLQDLMNSLANGGAAIFGGPAFGGNCTGVGGGGGQEQETGFGGFDAGLCNMDEAKFHHHGLSRAGSLGGSDRLTRDFLGVGGMVRGMGGGISPREQHHGIDIGSMDTELKSASSGRSFAGGSLQ